MREENEDLVLNIVPLPELHLLMGFVNHVSKYISSFWFGFDEWIKGLGILRKGYHGGTYDGNACRNLLKRTGELRKVLPTNLIPLIETMVKFDAVVHSTFGMELKENCHVAISGFVDS